ncbi:MAG: polysaccharide deacetylase family protein [Clostridia bacterium]|nr:polysaccharide deacetylase family protein [Clostridia bacterium]
MRTLLWAILLAVFLGGATSAAAEEKYETTPAMFRIGLAVTERVNGVPKAELPRGENKFRSYVRKEYLITANPRINETVAAIVDAFDARLSPEMREEEHPSSRYSSRLDIETVYTISGNTVSVLVLARETFRRQQLRSPFQTGVYDLETGQEIYLTDLFLADSPAWAVLATGVEQQLGAMFPNEPRHPESIKRFANREALEHASFTLSGGELTLHYLASDIYPGKSNVLHVRFYYPQFVGMWTDVGQAATDNSKWKLIALTFDDGPNYTDVGVGGSRWALPKFRAAGWRVTYYIWGKNIIEHPDVLMSQADNNHSMQNHSADHPRGSEVKTERALERQVNPVNDNMADTIGPRPTTFRAPFGSTDPWVRLGINMPLIQWSIDPKDIRAEPRTIVTRIKKQLHDGGIVLLHDTRKGTTNAIPLIAQMLLDEGYMTVTVDELAAINGITLLPGRVYYRFGPEE